MLYLNYFKFPNADSESTYLSEILRTCYDSFYPFGITSKHALERIDFEPITILYGGNGSGKSTALNIIAEKLEIQRDSIFNKSNFYPDYIKMCTADFERNILFYR